MVRLIFKLSPFLISLCSSVAMAQDDRTGLSVLPDADASFLRQNLPQVVIERVAPADTTDISSGRWMPLEHRKYVFKGVGDVSGSLQLTLTPTRRAPGSKNGISRPGWLLNQPNGTTKFLTGSDPGSVEAPVAVSTSNGFIIRLDPPEPIVLEGTVTRTEQVSVGIYDLHAPESESYSGKVSCTWTDLGIWRVRVPHGEHEARLLKIHYTGSIGPASVDSRRYLFLSDGIGPVAFAETRDISAFLIINDDSNESGVLESWEVVPERHPPTTPDGTTKSGG